MTEKLQQIIAMGGGGFSMEPENPRLDQFILAQTGKSSPAVCFIPPAPWQDYIDRFRAAFAKLPCRTSDLIFFPPPTADLESFILEKDVIYVGGGTTKSMLAVWREWNFPQILQKALQNGVILAGLSAGAICWFDWGVTDSIPGELTPLKCLGFLPGSNCPHYDGQPERRPAFHRLLQEGKIPPGYAADDGAALHFINGKLDRVVASRPNATAYRLTLENGKAIERALDARQLK
jgi:peptidase E